MTPIAPRKLPVCSPRCKVYFFRLNNSVKFYFPKNSAEFLSHLNSKLAKRNHCKNMFCPFSQGYYWWRMWRFLISKGLDENRNVSNLRQKYEEHIWKMRFSDDGRGKIGFHDSFWTMCLSRPSVKTFHWDWSWGFLILWFSVNLKAFLMNGERENPFFNIDTWRSLKKSQCFLELSISLVSRVSSLLSHPFEFSHSSEPQLPNGGHRMFKRKPFVRAHNLYLKEFRAVSLDPINPPTLPSFSLFSLRIESNMQKVSLPHFSDHTLSQLVYEKDGMRVARSKGWPAEAGLWIRNAKAW